MAGLKVYYDLMSQPSRAVVLFLKANNIRYEDKPVALRSGEHMTEEYAKINPFQLVPVIDDNGFKLTESVAILKYLAVKYRVPDHWYPAELQRRARVDQYMAWQHANTRLTASMVFRIQVIEPRAKNIPIDQEKLRVFKAALEKNLDYIENVFLKDQSYLCGNDISIADLLGICELMQPLASGQDVSQGRPILGAWMERVKNRLAPHYEPVNKVVYRVRDLIGANL